MNFLSRKTEEVLWEQWDGGLFITSKQVHLYTASLSGDQSWKHHCCWTPGSDPSDWIRVASRCRCNWIHQIAATAGSTCQSCAAVIQPVSRPSLQPLTRPYQDNEPQSAPLRTDHEDFLSAGQGPHTTDGQWECDTSAGVGRGKKKKSTVFSLRKGRC